MKSLVPTVLQEAIVLLVRSLSLVLLVIFARLVHSFLNHVTLVHITLHQVQQVVRNALRDIIARLQLDGIQRQMIDSNALGDISA